MNDEERILFLENENAQIKSQLKAINEMLEGLCGAMGGILTQLEQNIGGVDRLSLDHDSFLLLTRNMLYEWNDPRTRGRELFYPQFRSNEETLRRRGNRWRGLEMENFPLRSILQGRSSSVRTNVWRAGYGRY